MPRDLVIGWDIGGAHVKAVRVEQGIVTDIVQLQCPLWQGLEQLDAAVAQGTARWSDHADAAHAVTMTGEMADLFEHREAGVIELARRLVRHLGERAAFYAGEAGWCAHEAVAAHWSSIASANWKATAQVVARRLRNAVLVDIGSTTTDLIPVLAGEIVARGGDDADRLHTGELVYQGVVRTPLCALAHRIDFRGEAFNVMNELFATTADVYRLTDELDPLHDQYPPADGRGKDLSATRRRLARMIGHDARDASDADWTALARSWRALQLGRLDANLTRVLAAHDGARGRPVIVTAGCGAFLGDALAVSHDYACVRFSTLVEARADVADWVQVCAPGAAVAMLLRDTADVAFQGARPIMPKEPLCGS